MNSCTSVFITVFVTAIALVIAGCGHKKDNSHAHESGEAEHAHEAEAGVTFNAKNGLHVPQATAEFIGLQVADVNERRIASIFRFDAIVYQAASESQFASLQPGRAPTTLASGNVSPTDTARLSEGQDVSVQGGDDGLARSGRIVALNRDLEKASGHVEVLLAISDAQQPLASGDSVSVTVSLGGEKNAVSVPRSSVFRTTEGDFVYTVSGEHFVRAPVKLGSVNHEFVEVTDGLYEGDQIVVKPAMMLWMAELQSLRGGKACADGH